MTNRIHQVYIPLSRELVEELIKGVPPAYSSVFCQRITLAHGGADRIEMQPRRCVVYAVHNDPARQVQSLLVELDGELWRDDGRPFWITHSIGVDVSPVEAGNINPDRIKHLEYGYEFTGQPVRAPARVLKPRTRSLAA